MSNHSIGPDYSFCNQLANLRIDDSTKYDCSKKRKKNSTKRKCVNQTSRRRFNEPVYHLGVENEDAVNEMGSYSKRKLDWKACPGCLVNQ